MKSSGDESLLLTTLTIMPRSSEIRFAGRRGAKAQYQLLLPLVPVQDLEPLPCIVHRLGKWTLGATWLDTVFPDSGSKVARQGIREIELGRFREFVWVSIDLGDRYYQDPDILRSQAEGLIGFAEEELRRLGSFDFSQPTILPLVRQHALRLAFSKWVRRATILASLLVVGSAMRWMAKNW